MEKKNRGRRSHWTNEILLFWVTHTECCLSCTEWKDVAARPSLKWHSSRRTWLQMRMRTSTRRRSRSASSWRTPSGVTASWSLSSTGCANSATSWTGSRITSRRPDQTGWGWYIMSGYEKVWPSFPCCGHMCACVCVCVCVCVCALLHVLWADRVWFGLGFGFNTRQAELGGWSGGGLMTEFPVPWRLRKLPLMCFKHKRFGGATLLNHTHTYRVEFWRWNEFFTFCFCRFDFTVREFYCISWSDTPGFGVTRGGGFWPSFLCLWRRKKLGSGCFEHRRFGGATLFKLHACVCEQTYTYTCTCTHTHNIPHTHIHTHAHTHTTHICTQTCMHSTCTHSYTNTHAHTHTYHTHAYMCTQTHTQTETERARERHFRQFVFKVCGIRQWQNVLGHCLYGLQHQLQIIY